MKPKSSKFKQPLIRPFIRGCFMILSLLATNCVLFAQQTPDTSFTFEIQNPAYHPEKGPMVLIDEAHCNFHTKESGFYSFAKLLKQDGYRVGKLQDKVTNPKNLASCRILVIANALHPSDTIDITSTNQSAFTETEIDLIKNWVESGGRLLLIADHMPFAGAANELAQAFGFSFLNGFAYTRDRGWPPSLFTLKQGNLKRSPITTEASQPVDTVATFTGSAFSIPEAAIPVLAFSHDDYALMPDTAWHFNKNTPSVKLDGYCQGAIMDFGLGKIAVFGEAAMFTAQIVNGNIPAGINSPGAPQNARFVLNLFRWLD